MVTRIFLWFSIFFLFFLSESTTGGEGAAEVRLTTEKGESDGEGVAKTLSTARSGVEALKVQNSLGKSSRAKEGVRTLAAGP